MIKCITETEVQNWISKQKNIHSWHKEFRVWKKHLLLLSKTWPHVKKFYKGTGTFLGYYDSELVAVYWYNQIGDEIYDGYLISSKPGAGLKLGRYLSQRVKWKENWSMCSERYLKFNQRIGFVEKDRKMLDNEEWILLWRQKKS